MSDLLTTGERIRLYRLKHALRSVAAESIDTATSFDELAAVLRVHASTSTLTQSEAQRLAWKLRPDLQFGKPRFSTQEIVETLAHVLAQRMQEQSFDSFETWHQRVRTRLSEIQPHLPPAIAQSLPLSEEVMKLVFAELCGRMPFSRSYVISKYERMHQGMPYLFFPASQAKRLLILFSGNAGRKTHNRYSWYWDELEEWSGDTACLFLCDVDSHWYVAKEGGDERRMYRDIISMALTSLGLGADRAYAVGASMGGYGAILYALQMGLGAAIAVHPQLNFRSVLRYKEPSWEDRMIECGRNFRGLTDEVCRFDHRPVVYLGFGDNDADRCGVDEFVSGLCRREAMVIVRHTQIQGHLTDSPLKHHISAIVQFVEGFQGLAS